MGVGGSLRHELARLMTRRRFMLAGAVMLVAGVASMIVTRGSFISLPDIDRSIEYTGSMLWLTQIDQTGFFFLAWPLVIGGTLAEDLESGLAALLITRSGSRRRWFGAKIGAAYISSTLLLLLVAVFWLIVAAVLAPWDPTHAGGVVAWGSQLATSAPLVLGLVVVLILGLAAAATSAASMLFSALGAGRTVSQVGATVLYLLFMVSLPGPVNPGDRASMLSCFAGWATPIATVTYWAGVLGLTTTLTYALLRVRENR
ncbi:MAG: hypothetical protein RBS17_00055 [Coriobacteriia bacterium]|nr:hypothetical protein [Coriobacteriia bacterium]